MTNDELKNTAMLPLLLYTQGVHAGIVMFCLCNSSFVIRNSQVAPV